MLINAKQLKLVVSSERFGSVLTAFAGCSVLAVLGPVAFNHLPFSVVPPDGE